jgi:hypothetical protein
LAILAALREGKNVKEHSLKNACERRLRQHATSAGGNKKQAGIIIMSIIISLCLTNAFETFNCIGSRWGEKVEENYRWFAEEVVAQWGGTVTKWRRSITMTDEYGRVYKQPYEIDGHVLDLSL